MSERPLYVVKENASNIEPDFLHIPKPGTLVEITLGEDIDDTDEDGDVCVVEVGVRNGTLGWVRPIDLRPLEALSASVTGEEGA